MDRIILGSGDLYIAEYDGETAPTVTALKKTENQVGEISSGATLEYTNETYTAKSDNGKRQKTVITNETVVLSPGLCSLDEAKIVRLIPTARVAEDAANKKTVIKIGGTNNDNGKSYAILFYHTDKTDGDIAVMIVGKNTNGLTLTFKKENETILDPKFTAEPNDDDGTLVILEFYDSDATSVQTQAAGAGAKSVK